MAYAMLRAPLLPPEHRFSVGTLSIFDLATVLAALCAFYRDGHQPCATGEFKNLWADAVTPDSGLAWLDMPF